MRKRAQAGEDAYPVMLRLIGDGADRHQRQLPAEGIRHVGGDAGQAVKEGEGAEGRARKFAPHGKAYHQQRGNEQLQQRSAPESQRLSKPAEEKVPTLM